MIPPEKALEVFRAEMARIESVLTSQRQCPEPFRLKPAELAECILHHAEKAYEMAKAAERGGYMEGPDDVPSGRAVAG